MVTVLAAVVAGVILVMINRSALKPMADTPPVAGPSTPEPSAPPDAETPAPASGGPVAPPTASATDVERESTPEARRRAREVPAPSAEERARGSRAGQEPVERPVRVGGTIQPPRKLRNVRPAYPQIAQSARVEGTVIIEATLDARGKVAETRVLRSVPLLDQAALDAVRQWEYEPTLVNGAPVPVIMTVTVNFRLR